jgi:hypothetical protein
MRATRAGRLLAVGRGPSRRRVDARHQARLRCGKVLSTRT